MTEAIVSWSGLRSRMADRPLSLAQGLTVRVRSSKPFLRSVGHLSITSAVRGLAIQMMAYGAGHAFGEQVCGAENDEYSPPAAPEGFGEVHSADRGGIRSTAAPQFY